MTKDEEIRIIKDWAINQTQSYPSGYDMVIPYKTVKGVNVYKLWNSAWKPNHKMGYPKLVIIENNIPVRLSIDSVKAVIAFSS